MPAMLDQRPAEITSEMLSAPIETRRLILRSPESDDIPALCRLINDKVIAWNTGFIRYPYPPRSAWQWLSAAGHPKRGRLHMPFLLRLRSNPKLFAGAAGISIGKSGLPTIGYWLARPYRGNGFAAEAARALISVVFSKSDIAAVGASARTSNITSQRVLEAAGMRRVGRGQIRSVQLGRYVPVLVYRIERKSWEKAFASRAG